VRLGPSSPLYREKGSRLGGSEHPSGAEGHLYKVISWGGGDAHEARSRLLKAAFDGAQAEERGETQGLSARMACERDDGYLAGRSAREAGET